MARNEALAKQMEEVLDKMLEEEVKIMESLKINTKLTMKLCKELEV